MALNYVWIGFFLVGFVVAIVRTIIGYWGGGTEADMHVFETIGSGLFAMSKGSFATVALGLAGTVIFWMGMMRVGEKAGAVNFLSRVIGPFFRRLFPEIPNGHPAQGQIMLNFSANMLGLSNAATPMGLKAMESMQELNKDKETASNPMIMFLALNTASLTLIPVTIMGLRAQAGATNPTDVFVPILISSFCATLVALIVVAIRQRINLFEKALFTFLVAGIAVMGGIVALFLNLSPEKRTAVSSVGGNFILLGIIASFILAAASKKINVFSTFIDGAKDGFSTILRIAPYLVGMLVAISVFRNCGALDYLTQATTWFFELLGVDTRFVPAMPVAYMKPFSGSGTEGLVVDAMKAHGAESFVGRLASVMYASADTTFYILALYFGSVGVKKTRYALGAGLIADLAGVLAAIFVSYLFWGSDPAPERKTEAAAAAFKPVACDSIRGDYNGDGKTETAVLYLVKDGSTNLIANNDSAAVFEVRFSDKTLAPLPAGCCDIRLVKEEDLDGDGAGELSIFSNEGNGCSYLMRTYSLKKNKWAELLQPFVITTGCDPVSDSTLQSRVFREGKRIYYLIADPNDETRTLVKKPAVLKAPAR